jgi:hypothetical protein
MRTSHSLVALLMLTATALTGAERAVVCDDGCANEPWHLFSQDNDHGIIAGGWINGGVMANFDNNSVTRNDPVPFSNPAGEFLAN